MKKLLFVFAAALMLASCAKDPNKVTNEALDGDWDITSMTLDGEELYGDGNLLEDGTIKFTMDEDATGSMSTTISFLGASSTTTGTYEISGEGETITMTDSDGEKTTATISVEDDVMTMTSTNDEGKEEVQKAKKK